MQNNEQAKIQGFVANVRWSNEQEACFDFRMLEKAPKRDTAGGEVVVYPDWITSQDLVIRGDLPAYSPFVVYQLTVQRGKGQQLELVNIVDLKRTSITAKSLGNFAQFAAGRIYAREANETERLAKIKSFIDRILNDVNTLLKAKPDAMSSANWPDNIPNSYTQNFLKKNLHGYYESRSYYALCEVLPPSFVRRLPEERRQTVLDQMVGDPMLFVIPNPYLPVIVDVNNMNALLLKNKRPALPPDEMRSLRTKLTGMTKLLRNTCASMIPDKTMHENNDLAFTDEDISKLVNHGSLFRVTIKELVFYQTEREHNAERHLRDWIADNMLFSGPRDMSANPQEGIRGNRLMIIYESDVTRAQTLFNHVQEDKVIFCPDPQECFRVNARLDLKDENAMLWTEAVFESSDSALTRRKNTVYFIWSAHLMSIPQFARWIELYQPTYVVLFGQPMAFPRMNPSDELQSRSALFYALSQVKQVPQFHGIGRGQNAMETDDEIHDILYRLRSRFFSKQYDNLSAHMGLGFSLDDPNPVILVSDDQTDAVFQHVMTVGLDRVQMYGVGIEELKRLETQWEAFHNQPERGSSLLIRTNDRVLVRMGNRTFCGNVTNIYQNNVILPEASRTDYDVQFEVADFYGSQRPNGGTSDNGTVRIPASDVIALQNFSNAAYSSVGCMPRTVCWLSKKISLAILTQLLLNTEEQCILVGTEQQLNEALQTVRPPAVYLAPRLEALLSQPRAK